MERMKGARSGALAIVVALVFAGCALRSNWHWEKPGAGEEELSWDQNQCKARVYAGSDGAVTSETVRRMFACMEARGWSKAAD